MTRGRLVAACAVLALLMGALPAAASAGDFSSTGSDPSGSAPGGQSAGDQYVETLPTTRGPRAPGKAKHRKKLSRGVLERLHRLGGSDAAALEALSTSTALGAPVQSPGAKGSARNGSSKGAAAKSRSRSKRHGNTTPAVPSAAINAVDGGEAGLGWLVLAILAITALALGAVGYQRHRDKGSAG